VHTTYGKGLRGLSIAAIVTIGAALALAHAQVDALDRQFARARQRRQHFRAPARRGGLSGRIRTRQATHPASLGFHLTF